MKLEYAQPQRFLMWRRYRRMVVMLVAAVIFGIGGWRAEVRYWPTIHVYFLQKQALSYSSPDYFCVIRYETKKSDMVVSKGALSYDCSWAVPPAWGDYARTANICYGPTLYMGYRTSSAGHQRLVAVQSLPGFGTDMSHPKERSRPFAIVANAIAPATITTLPRLIRLAHVGLCGQVEPDAVLQLFAGHADAADQAHFTIIYQVGSQRGTIDGYLQNDDTVALQIRDGPATGGVTSPF